MEKNYNSYPISSKSRTKLNAFRYDDKVEQSPEKSPSKSPFKSPSKRSHMNKENQTSWLNGVVEQDEPKEQPSSQTADSKPIKECPQTPGNRLPLADLINNAEDAFIGAPGQEFTPEDQVIWQHVPASSNTDFSQSPTKKRRHSSSPGSSPLANNSKNVHQEPFDLQPFQALLKTPQTDLATDLWNNYVGKSALNGNGDLPPPRLANLLSSSPQTPATAKTSRDSSGLRRAISCNAEWPTSNAKRRRVDGEGSKTSRNIFSQSRSNFLDSGESKTASLKSLVERIESLHKVPTPQADPPSSSPVPMRTNIKERNRPMSPIEEKTALKTSEKVTKEGKENARPEPRDLQDTNLQSSSSEFEDDDLDLDLLEFAGGSLEEPTESHDNVQPVTSESINGYMSQEPHIEKARSFDTTTQGVNTRMTDKSATNDVDEFDDDDDLPESIHMILDGRDKATVSTELEKPSTNYSANLKQAASISGKANAEPCKETRKPQEVSSGDEFDDEDFDLEAIEQSMKQSGEDGPSHVCRS